MTPAPERSRTISPCHAGAVPYWANGGKSRLRRRTLRGCFRAGMPLPQREEATGHRHRPARSAGTPERTAALVTPDRALAARVAAHLRRWGIDAATAPVRPLSHLPPGTLLLALAKVMAERFAPVALLNSAQASTGAKRRRAAGMAGAGEGARSAAARPRALCLDLRGSIICLPKPADEGDRQAKLRQQVAAWWPQARELLAPLEQLGHDGRDAATIFAVPGAKPPAAWTNEAVWAGHQGHAAADLFAEIKPLFIWAARSFRSAPCPTAGAIGWKLFPVRPPPGWASAHRHLCLLRSAAPAFGPDDPLPGSTKGTWPACLRPIRGFSAYPAGTGLAGA